MNTSAESSLACPVEVCTKEPQLPLTCATSYNFLSPLLLAEELCPQVVAAAIRNEQARLPKERDLNFEAGHNFRLGSLFLDLSNAWGVQDSSSRKFAARGFELLGGV